MKKFWAWYWHTNKWWLAFSLGYCWFLYGAHEVRGAWILIGVLGACGLLDLLLFNWLESRRQP